MERVQHVQSIGKLRDVEHAKRSGRVIPEPRSAVREVDFVGLRSRRGASFALLGLLADGAFEISVSVPLVLEYEAVARRQARELGLTHADVDAVVDLVCTQAHHRKIFYLWRPFLRDQNDDMVLEVAVDAQCSYIVTFNTRDFAGIEQFEMQTLTPGEFLALLQEDA